MPKLIEMDDTVALSRQMQASVGPVVLINKFSVAAADVDRFLAAWTADAAVMKRQPGFIDTQLHRGIAGSGVFVNVATWESVEHFRQAFGNPEFRASLGAYPDSATGSPHLFTRVAVPGICVA